MALEVFFGSATQYYVAGRFAVLAGQIPVAGNLLHHAVEMYLKGGLSKTHSLPQLKRLAHDLPKIWATFKTQFGSSTLVLRSTTPRARVNRLRRRASRANGLG